jgi:hypothetical protein
MVEFKVIDNGTGEILCNGLTYYALTVFLHGAVDMYYGLLCDGLTIVAEAADDNCDICDMAICR